MTSYDIIVLGAGPSGATAALYLAMNNYKVILIEKEKLPRYKTCGGGVVNKGIKLLPIAPDGSIDKVCYRSVIYDHKLDKKFQLERKNPIIKMTMRDNFDYFLIREGIKNGLVLKDSTPARSIIKHSDHSQVVTDSGSYSAEFVIASTGGTGLVRKNNVLKVPALESEIFTDSPTFDNFKDTARFDFGLIDHGYGWVFPKKNHLSIGIGVLNHHKNGRNLNDLLKSYLSKLGITKIIKYDSHGYFIPIIPKESVFTDDRTLITGDAAGFADPITAEGISWAILSGKLAAEAIIDGNLRRESVIRNYNESVRREILTELKYAKIIYRLVYGSEKVRAFLFRTYGQRLCELMTDIIMGEKTYREVLTSKSNYLKLIKYYIKNKLDRT